MKEFTKIEFLLEHLDIVFVRTFINSKRMVSQPLLPEQDSTLSFKKKKKYFFALH